jgi:polyisoprenyl-phosphate glycosyltransferase
MFAQGCGLCQNCSPIRFIDPALAGWHRRGTLPLPGAAKPGLVSGVLVYASATNTCRSTICAIRTMLSLVIPVYKNEGNIPPLMKALAALHRALEGHLEVVFVVDGSPDRSHALLSELLTQATFPAQLLLLSRNFGSFSAIRAGLKVARGQRFAVMAADLQEPPELVLAFDEQLRSGDCDVVIGQRDGRDDPLLSRMSSQVFWRLYRRWVQPEIPPGGVDVFACGPKVRREILRMRERNSSLIGLLFWVGFRRSFVGYKRRPRVIGRSGWTLGRKVRYLGDSVFSFTDMPIRILTGLGTLALIGSLVFAAIVLHRRIFASIPVPGYAATVLLVTFFGALNSLGLGIIGGYVWRTFENTKRRPGYIVMHHQRFDHNEESA